MARLFLAFLILPVVEIWLITQVAGVLGWLETIVLVIAVSLGGAWLVRREGIGVIRRLQRSLNEARMPTNELADGAMIFFAAALMLTPGFLTDFFGLALLIPPIRAVLRPPVIAFFRRRLQVRVNGLGGPMGGGGFGAGMGDADLFGPGASRPRQRGDVFDVDPDGVRPDGDGDDGGGGSDSDPDDRPRLP